MSRVDVAKVGNHRELEEFESAYVHLLQERHRCTRRLAFGYGMAIAFNLLAMVMNEHLSGKAVLPLYLRAGLLVITLSAFIVQPAANLETARKRIGEMFSTASSPILVGSLLRHGRGPGGVYKSTRIGLKRILPGVRADHAVLIDDTAMNGLFSLLRNPRDPELTIAVLKALEQIGVSRAIPLVRRLTFPQEWPVGAYRSSRHTDRIVGAATACLPYLEQRATIEQRGATLLRPIGVTPERELLHPAASTPESADSLLHTIHDQ